MYPVPRQHPASRPLALVQIQKGQLRDVIAGCLQPGAALAPSVCTGQPRKLLHTQRGEHRACQKLGNRAARGTAHQLCREIGGGGIIGEKCPRLMGQRRFKKARTPSCENAACGITQAACPVFMESTCPTRRRLQRASPEHRDAYSGNQSSTRSSGCSFPIPNATPAAVEVKLLLSEYISRLSPQL